MKNKYTILGSTFALACVGILSLSSFDTVTKVADVTMMKFTNGAPAGKTGAPGEVAACTQCHSGSVLDGNTVNQLSINGGAVHFLPNEALTLTLNFTDADAKNGFQLTVLDGNDNAAGTLSAADGSTTFSSGSGRQYINHNASSTSNSSWSFNWTAPAEDITSVSFYVATNKTNANGGNSGDKIYTSKHDFVQDPSAGIFEEVVTVSEVAIGYSPSNNTLIIDFDAVNNNKGYLNLVNLSGQSVLAESTGEITEGANHFEVRLPSELESGIYVANYFIGNKATSQKIYIQK